MLAWPSDNTSPFIMGYKGAASVSQTQDSAPETSSSDAEGSDTDVSYRARRPKMNPGDIAITTRDENFLMMRRGGVVQIGSTAISQRIYIPILNYIKDFCENYSMESFGGELSWTVMRDEDDPEGDAPAQYLLMVNSNAQDAAASVRVRYMALPEPGESDRAAWEVRIAPKGVDRDTGDITNEVYSLIVSTAGDQIEIVGGSRDLTISGDDAVTIQGSREVEVAGDDTLAVSGSLDLGATNTAALYGTSQTRVGSSTAANPAVKGQELIQFLASAVYIVDPSTNTAKLSPPAVVQLQTLLSNKVFLV